MSEKLHETITLDNHLRLEIWDLSRVVAGDRWLVSLEIRIDIPLEIAHLESIPDKEKVFAILRKAFGEKVTYRHKQEKHFVDEKGKDDVFQSHLERLKDNLLSYLSHPDFARKFVLSKYLELKNRSPQLFQ